ncbi:Sec39 domain-containing protein [Paraphoma chrysanthemicola]|uniref:Sec39 domain-containing protein n=1 Tax=Paraphoma chrysanthemicola TaxID=798071 RepID=A0A8K0R181_9PLEO|nr:Sec39 domain-containing protein [Paraphoma chrysanthemicola]
MASLQKLRQLSAAHCVLLAVQYATESNIAALRALTALRDADLPLDLTLRILLSYLPEELEPSAYIEFLHELATGARNPGDNAAASLDIASVAELSVSRAKKRRKALDLLPIAHPHHTQHATDDELDTFSHFLIHRAHRIDAQTGLLDLIPQLLVPFLGHTEYLRTWFISTVLPLLRLNYEYYPQTASGSLSDFASLKGKTAIDYQLSQARNISGADAHNVARDLKGVVAPWMCGANERKRRKLSSDGRRASIAQDQPQEPDDWDCLFQWILHTSKDNFSLAAIAFREWDGPEDMDLGGYEEGRDYVDDEQQRQLEMKYAQTALACLYLADSADTATLQTAHSLLSRICDLMNNDPPPDLNAGVDALPSYNLRNPLLRDSTISLLQEQRLLEPNNAITKPSEDTVQLIQLMLFSAYTLSSLEHPTSIREVAKMSLRDDRPEQLSLLQKILYKLGSSRKEDERWINARQKLLWLWNWGTQSHDDDRHAQGIFGMLESSTVETEILKALIESSHYPLAVQTYIKSSTAQPLTSREVEQVVLTSAMNHYDNASNGNRTRGGMKRAAEIIAAFSPHFPQSSRFQRMQALLSATHAMSFYSLILEHGVPFQPVNIRVSSNPLSLVRKLLSQNGGSYTKLDDLISIGQNLVVSKPATIMEDEDETPLDASAVGRRKAAAERRVIGMAIDAALAEDDFETAYSYVVNRLTPSTPAATPSATSQLFAFALPDVDEPEDDAEDVAWRAALRAGRYSSSTANNSWTQSAARPDLRRLEQRMELLSQALILAPTSHLEEVLSVWQQCEAETTALLAEETAAEERFNDAADRKLPGTFVNETIAIQPRREVGRGATEEAPLGLFDVARGAAAAFSKSAFPLRGSAQAASNTTLKDNNMSSSRASLDFSDSGSMNEDRVRKRDMVASAATGALATGTGALASGLGWMLGAKPVHEQERE